MNTATLAEGRIETNKAGKQTYCSSEILNEDLAGLYNTYKEAKRLEEDQRARIARKNKALVAKIEKLERQLEVENKKMADILDSNQTLQRHIATQIVSKGEIKTSIDEPRIVYLEDEDKIIGHTVEGLIPGAGTVKWSAYTAVRFTM